MSILIRHALALQGAGCGICRLLDQDVHAQHAHWRYQGVMNLCSMQGTYACAGVCGFSMGGVHASMVASLYPGPVACVPLLAPRSAAAAFCHGALREATAWQPLVAAADEAQKVRCSLLWPTHALSC